MIGGPPMWGLFYEAIVVPTLAAAIPIWLLTAIFGDRRAGLVGWALTVIGLLVFARGEVGLWTLIGSVISVPVAFGITFIGGQGPSTWTPPIAARILLALLVITACWVLYTH